jgi:mannose-6-phosphate isomerase
MTRCNCDASCGENRYHDVGSSECRFGSEEEHDAYWQLRQRPARTILSEPKRMLSDQYTKEEPQELIDMSEKPYIESATRPWGSWYVLDLDQGFKVKRLEILPDQAISLQYHVHRAEIWNIIQGEGKVIVDGNIFKVTKGDTFVVPKQALHKITNTHLTETLIAIEVQMGEICSEDDIVRC